MSAYLGGLIVDTTPEHGRLEASGGWCAPSTAVYDLADLIEDPVGIRTWPAGLTAEDIDWLSEMLTVAEIDPGSPLDLPTLQVRRGGITYPAS